MDGLIIIIMIILVINYYFWIFVGVVYRAYKENKRAKKTFDNYSKFNQTHRPS